MVNCSISDPTKVIEGVDSIKESLKAKYGENYKVELENIVSIFKDNGYTLVAKKELESIDLLSSLDDLDICICDYFNREGKIVTNTKTWREYIEWGIKEYDLKKVDYATTSIDIINKYISLIMELRGE